VDHAVTLKARPGPYGDCVADAIYRQSSRLALLIRKLETSEGPVAPAQVVRSWAVRTESRLKGLALADECRAEAGRDALAGGIYAWAVRHVRGGDDEFFDRLGAVACLIDRGDGSFPTLDTILIEDIYSRWASARSHHPVTSRVLESVALKSPCTHSSTSVANASPEHPETTGSLLEIRQDTADHSLLARKTGAGPTKPRGSGFEKRLSRGKIDPTRALIESMDALLDALAVPDIAWNQRAVAAKWVDLIKRVRAVDRDNRVPIYSYYTTPPEVTHALLDRVEIDGPVWEPCSGDGAIVRVLEERGHVVHASDIRTDEDVCGRKGIDLFDLGHAVNIITNPPFNRSLSLLEHLISIAQRMVAVLLRVDFLALFARRKYFRANPPRLVYVFTERPLFRAGGDSGRRQSGKWEYAWFLWERDRPGNTEVIYIGGETDAGRT
jgi:hypothetical protein